MRLSPVPFLRVFRFACNCLPLASFTRPMGASLLAMLGASVLGYAQDAGPAAYPVHEPIKQVHVMRPASVLPDPSLPRVHPKLRTAQPNAKPLNTGSGIEYTCDPSVPAFTCNYLNTTVASYYNSTFTNANADIYITYGTTGLGESTTGFYNFVTYDQYVAALTSNANKSPIQTDALSALNTYDATPYGSDYVEVTSALGLALGLSGMTGTTVGGEACSPPSSGCYNGIITVIDDPQDYGFSLYYDNLGGTEPSDAYDYYAVVEHETDEVLGTASCMDTAVDPLADDCDSAVPSGGPGSPSAVDLFRYSSAGHLVLDSSLSTTPGAYFSFNGGSTNGANGKAGTPKVYNTLDNGDDYADFLSSSPDCGTNIAIQDAEGCPGEDAGLTILNDGGGEINILEAVGFNVPTQSAATLTSPTPNSTFTSTSITFDWTAPTGATAYLLHLGSTGVGSSNLDSSGKITGNTVTFNALPANGETIYARLFTYYGTASVSADYTYTAITATAATLTTPVPSSTFTSNTVTFGWAAVTGATKYLLELGTTGVGSSNVYTSGGVTGTSATATGLPGKGETIYARLYTYFGTTSVSADFTYTDVTQSTLTTPTPGSTFTSTNVTFDWTAATGASKYLLHLGTTGVGSSNVYSSGGVTGTTATAVNLPGNGETVYVRLYTYWGTAYATSDYTYTDVTQSSLTTPTPGSTFTSTSVTFDWKTATGATKYLLHLGSTGVGSSNLDSSGQIAGTTFTFSSLPSNGETIYARLFTYWGTAYAYSDYTYTALTATAATLNSPTPGSTLVSPSTTFGWTAVTGATKYLLELGTTGVGSSNLYNSGGTTGTTATANSLPGKGETIYARLYTYFGTVSVSTDSTYTDVTQSVLTTPTPGTAFTSTSVTFDWTAATGATKYLLHVGSTGVGSSNLDSSGQITGTTVTFTGLPTNGETIYVRLYTYFGTASAYTDYTYTAQ